MTRFLRLVFAATLLIGAGARAAQAPLSQPVVGPHSMSDLNSNYLNPALLSLASCNSGSTAPANGPGSLPVLFECWINTAASPNVMEIYDGISWVPVGAIDPVAHTWANASGEPGVGGLSAINDGTNPTTTMRMSARSVSLYNPTLNLIEKFILNPTANLPCAINTLGAGGRDQSGVFSSGQTIELFYIWGATPGLNCIWSQATAGTGPALPSGYTSFAPAFPIILVGSATLQPVIAGSGSTNYNVTDHEVLFEQPPLIVLGGYPSYTFNLSTYIPQTAFITEFIMDAEAHASAGGAVLSGFVCSHNSAITDNFCNISLYPTANWWVAQDNYVRVNLRATSQVFYGKYLVTGGTIDNVNTVVVVVGYTF